MRWLRRLLVCLPVLGVALWLTTLTASAQSLGLPNAPQAKKSSPAPPPAVTRTVQTTQTVHQEVHAARQAAAPVTRSVSKPVQTVTHTAATTVSTTTEVVQKVVAQVPVAVPTVVAPIADQAKAAVQPVVSAVEAAPRAVEVETQTALQNVSAPVAVQAAAPATNEPAPSEPAPDEDAPAPPPAPVVTMRAAQPVVHRAAAIAPRPPSQDEAAAEDTPPVEPEQPAPAMSLDATIIDVHDREPALVTESPAPRATIASLDVEAWPVLTPLVSSKADAAPSQPVPHGADRGVPSVERAPFASPAPGAEESVPRSAAPVGGAVLTFASSAPSSLLPTQTMLASSGYWQVATRYARRLPSVIVLPNLAPPG